MKQIVSSLTFFTALSLCFGIFCSQVSAADMDSIKLGKDAWQEYFEVDVGEEPPLPPNIEEILNEYSPSLEGDKSDDLKVKDNHLLVLIPAQVNGVPFNLTKLDELARAMPYQHQSIGYQWYHSDVRKSLGDKSPQSSYWVLITREMLKDSFNKSYPDQWYLVSQRGQQRGYVVPSPLEVATTCFLRYAQNGEYLFGFAPRSFFGISYSQSVFTACSDTDKVGNDWIGYRPVEVGSFNSDGLSLSPLNIEPSKYRGIAACRRF